MENEKFRFRPLSEADLPELLALYRQCEDFLALGPAATASEQMVLADVALTRPQGGVYGGIYIQQGDDWVLAGVLDVIPDYGGEAGCAELELLMLGAPFRGQGLGAAVVDWLFHQPAAELWGASKLQPPPRLPIRRWVAGVQANNPKAIRFWQRMGFHITGPARWHDDGTIAYPMKRELSVNSQQ